MNAGITVAIPTIPPRGEMLARAVRSVMAQTFPAAAISIAVDVTHDGAPTTRNQALAGVGTEWVAFLDDDDEFGPEHLERCLRFAQATRADLVYPWFDVVGGTDPFPLNFGRPWNPLEPRQFPITVLVKTYLMRRIGGFRLNDEDSVYQGQRVGEDFLAWVALSNLGARIRHLPQRTWHWHHHASNTSGLPNRW